MLVTRCILAAAGAGQFHSDVHLVADNSQEVTKLAKPGWNNLVRVPSFAQRINVHGSLSSHLPEEPRQTFGSLARLFGDEQLQVICQVEENSAAFEYPRVAMHHGRNTTVGIGSNKAAGKLVPFPDVDHVGIVLDLKLLASNGRLLAVRSGQTVELEFGISSGKSSRFSWPSSVSIGAGKPVPSQMFVSLLGRLGRCPLSTHGKENVPAELVWKGN